MSYPPRYSPPRDSVKRAPERFTVLPTIEGLQVIDFDGRPVAACETPAESRQIATDLNAAAFAGPHALIAELRSLA